MHVSSILGLVCTICALVLVDADPLDWISVDYIQSGRWQLTSQKTIDAQRAIIRNAERTLHTSYTIRNSKDKLPPSSDPRDYLSLAPYHWPACNWCGSSGRAHFAESSNSDPSSSTESDPYLEAISIVERHAAIQAHHLNAIRRNRGAPRDSLLLGRADIQSPFGLSMLPETSSTTSPPPAMVTNAAQAAAKTTKKSSCRPSPTTSMMPSATWTSCPYVVRDGQVNPDVRTIPGPATLVDVSHAAISNVLAFWITGKPDYCSKFSSIVKEFFVTPSSRMNPNMNCGQIVRGPGPAGQTGTFTGILDFRGLTKIMNAALLMRGADCPSWSTLEKSFLDWVHSYDNWLSTSHLAKTASTRPNNHASFFTSQAASVKLYLGDKSGARAALQHFFSQTFPDQIARNGEQPFEAVRTRPWHYRCFNLEALIANAKLCGELGLDCWSIESKNGATIRDAANFLIKLNPRGEDKRDCVSQIAAVAAAYGDPHGAYRAWLVGALPNFDQQPFWFYDQNAAMESKDEKAITGREVYGDELYECSLDGRVEISNGIAVGCDDLWAVFNRFM